MSGSPRFSSGVLCAALTAALLAGGCGRAVRIGAGGTLQVAVSEYRIDPPAITAATGPLTLVVHNYGRLTHNLVITSGEHADGNTPFIPPGGEATLVVDLGPGRYTLSSRVLADAALGMRGTLTIR